MYRIAPIHRGGQVYLDDHGKQPQKCSPVHWKKKHAKRRLKSYGWNSKNRENSPKWMVKRMENLIEMDDLGGKPTIFRNPPYVFQHLLVFRLRDFEESNDWVRLRDKQRCSRKLHQEPVRSCCPLPKSQAPYVHLPNVESLPAQLDNCTSMNLYGCSSTSLITKI